MLTAATTYRLSGGRKLPSVELNLVTGSDATGGRQLLIDMWNHANPHARVRVTTAGNNTADQKRQMIAEASNRTADIVNLDTIDIAGFARDQLIAPFRLPESNLFLPNVLDAGHRTADPKLFWAAPFNTDVGVLFERVTSDADPGVDGLRAAMGAVRDGSQGLIAQLGPASSASYEAFVVNVLEHALNQDEKILTDNVYDVGKWRQALAPLHSAILAKRITLADNEQDSLGEFVAHHDRRFMRNWPVAYRTLQQNNDADVKAGRIRVHPLPIGILGGQSLAIVSNSRYHDQATDVIDFLTGPEAQKVLAAHGLAPTRNLVYGDANLTAFIPHLVTLLGAVENARPRPVHYRYGAFSAAVVKYVQPFLRGSKGTELSPAFTDEIGRALT